VTLVHASWGKTRCPVSVQALEQAPGHLARPQARLAQRIAPLGRVPDPLAAIAADDGDAAAGERS
jgi:hypothetical protein